MRNSLTIVSYDKYSFSEKNRYLGNSDMSTRLQILSHACMKVDCNGDTIIVDPWLLGSCYWRSWWNFPRVKFDESEFNENMSVFISHVHWDHWHGPSLKRFFKKNPIYTPKAFNSRSLNDLKSIGLSKVSEIASGDVVVIGDIRVTFFSFGLYLEDAAIVIETPDIKILNVNDCKILDWPLDKILKKYGPFDFVLRSHSSANVRACCEINGIASLDDREHYYRSFKLFMDVVKPKYAVPFASNHCHLSEDTLHFNSYISDPIELGRWLEDKSRKWTYQPMLPGDSWSSSDGFAIHDTLAFHDKESYIAEYRLLEQHRLEKTKLREDRIKLPFESAEKMFSKFLSKAVRKSASSNPVKLVITKNGQPELAMKIHKNVIFKTDDLSLVPTDGLPVMIMPNVIFRDSIKKNMFHHASISKRCRFNATNDTDMKNLMRFFEELELVELLGTTKSLSVWSRFCMNLLIRPAELFVYVKVFFIRLYSGSPLWEIEEKLLQSRLKD